MEKLKFEFVVKACEDLKTNVICITSITDADKCTFLIPDQLQPVKLHDTITKTQAYQKVKTTLQKRHERRHVWISVTQEINNAYRDEEKNMQFKGYLLEEIVPETYKQTTTTGISEEALTKILENFAEMKNNNKSCNISNLSQKFVIQKFSGNTSNVSQWMTIFETECA